MKRVAFLTILFLPALFGCQHTREAYQAAESIDEYAYVLAEHYSALVREAADLKEKPTTPREAVKWMQQVDLKARPVILKLRQLRDAYITAQTAKTEEELQAAIDEAVLLIADMVRAVKSARGETIGAATPFERRLFEHETHLLEAA